MTLEQADKEYEEAKKRLADSIERAERWAPIELLIYKWVGGFAIFAFAMAALQASGVHWHPFGIRIL